MSEATFDYDKLTPEQQDLYCYGFNCGSKAAWEQAKREAAAGLAEARKPLVAALEAALPFLQALAAYAGEPNTLNATAGAVAESAAAALATAKETL